MFTFSRAKMMMKAVMALLKAADAAVPITVRRRQAHRLIGKRTRPMTWNRPHQGVQEIARRRRQIANFQLTLSNGLVDRYGVTVNSHGALQLP